MAETPNEGRALSAALAAPVPFRSRVGTGMLHSADRHVQRLAPEDGAQRSRGLGALAFVDRMVVPWVMAAQQSASLRMFGEYITRGPGQRAAGSVSWVFPRPWYQDELDWMSAAREGDTGMPPIGMPPSGMFTTRGTFEPRHSPAALSAPAALGYVAPSLAAESMGAGGDPAWSSLVPADAIANARLMQVAVDGAGGGAGRQLATSALAAMAPAVVGGGTAASQDRRGAGSVPGLRARLAALIAAGDPAMSATAPSRLGSLAPQMVMPAAVAEGYAGSRDHDAARGSAGAASEESSPGGDASAAQERARAAAAAASAAAVAPSNRAQDPIAPGAGTAAAEVERARALATERAAERASAEREAAAEARERATIARATETERAQHAQRMAEAQRAAVDAQRAIAVRLEESRREAAAQRLVENARQADATTAAKAVEAAAAARSAAAGQLPGAQSAAGQSSSSAAQAAQAAAVARAASSPGQSTAAQAAAAQAAAAQAAAGQAAAGQAAASPGQSRAQEAAAATQAAATQAAAAQTAAREQARAQAEAQLAAAGHPAPGAQAAAAAAHAGQAAAAQALAAQAGQAAAAQAAQARAAVAAQTARGPGQLGGTLHEALGGVPVGLRMVDLLARGIESGNAPSPIAGPRVGLPAGLGGLVAASGTAAAIGGMSIGRPGAGASWLATPPAIDGGVELGGGFGRLAGSVSGSASAWNAPTLALPAVAQARPHVLDHVAWADRWLARMAGAQPRALAAFDATTPSAATLGARRLARASAAPAAVFVAPDAGDFAGEHGERAHPGAAAGSAAAGSSATQAAPGVFRFDDSDVTPDEVFFAIAAARSRAPEVRPGRPGAPTATRSGAPTAPTATRARSAPVSRPTPADAVLTSVPMAPGAGFSPGLAASPIAPALASILPMAPGRSFDVRALFGSDVASAYLGGLLASSSYAVDEHGVLRTAIGGMAGIGMAGMAGLFAPGRAAGRAGEPSTVHAAAAAAPAMDVIAPHDAAIAGSESFAPSVGSLEPRAPGAEAFTLAGVGSEAVTIPGPIPGPIQADVGAAPDASVSSVPAPAEPGISEVVGGPGGGLDRLDRITDSERLDARHGLAPTTTLRGALLLPQPRDAAPDAAAPAWWNAIGSHETAAAVASLPRQYATPWVDGGELADGDIAGDGGELAGWTQPAAAGSVTGPLWSTRPGMTAERSRRWAMHTQQTAADLSLDFVSPEMVLAARVYGLSPADAAHATRLATGGPTALQVLAGAVEMTFLRALAGDAALREAGHAGFAGGAAHGFGGGAAQGFAGGDAAHGFGGGGFAAGAAHGDAGAPGFGGVTGRDPATTALGGELGGDAMASPSARGTFAGSASSAVMPTTAYPIGDAGTGASTTALTAASLASSIPTAGRRSPRGAFLWPAATVGALGMRAAGPDGDGALSVAALELLAAGAVAQLGSYAINHGATAEESAALVMQRGGGGSAFGFAGGAGIAGGFAGAGGAGLGGAGLGTAGAAGAFARPGDAGGTGSSAFAPAAGGVPGGVPSVAGGPSMGSESLDAEPELLATAGSIAGPQRARFHALYVALTQSALGREMSPVARAARALALTGRGDDAGGLSARERAALAWSVMPLISGGADVSAELAAALAGDARDARGLAGSAGSPTWSLRAPELTAVSGGLSTSSTPGYADESAGFGADTRPGLGSLSSRAGEALSSFVTPLAAPAFAGSGAPGATSSAASSSAPTMAQRAPTAAPELVRTARGRFGGGEVEIPTWFEQAARKMLESRGGGDGISLAEMTLVTAAPTTHVAASGRGGGHSASSVPSVNTVPAKPGMPDIEKLAQEVYAEFLSMMDTVRLRNNGEP